MGVMPRGPDEIPLPPPAPGLSGPPLATDFDRSVGFLVTALANKLSMGASQRLRKTLHIGLMEWRVVALLGAEGEAPPARVAQVAGVDKSVVSRAVTALERRGLIRVAPDGAGRQTLLALTPPGRDLHDRGIVGVIASEDRLLQGFDAAEQDILVRMLKRLTANLPDLFGSDPAS
jgi:DNA-binding MarR family transcriptional regulator